MKNSGEDMSKFDQMVRDAKTFYADLAQNNTKAHWETIKPDYETKLKAPAKDLLAVVADDLAAIYDTTIKTKLFRPHRDVRFSKDKTPYQTHLHMMWTDGERTNGPAWFFGVSPNYIRIGWGWMGFDKSQMQTWRDAVTMTALPDLIAATPGEISKPELKRVPPPFEKDHLQGDHLRRKSLALWVDGTDTEVLDQVKAQFKAVKPLHDELAPLLS